MEGEEEEEDEGEEEASESKPFASSPNHNHIPLEIVSEDEMALIEAALSAAAALIPSSSSPLLSVSRSLKRTITSPSKRTLACCSNAGTPSEEIEDLSGNSQMKEKKKSGGGLTSLYLRFRNRRGLSVTDITRSEWCEKQMEFILLHGKPKRTNAMKAGSARHAELEEEVVKRVELPINSVEESWAVKFSNFIIGTNQLLFEGLTREIPIVGRVEGVWMSGVIDEIRMPVTEADQNPLLVDIKTRYRATLPSEAQKRNSRFQLMCYKYLWDNMIADNFPLEDFFAHFELNPEYIFSEDVRQHISSSACNVVTFREFMIYFRNMCHLLPPSSEQLLLRYEYQGDNSLLGEYQFKYDDSWFKSQTLQCLKFWMGEREAGFVSKDERWKCGFCSFAGKCPMVNSQESQLENELPKELCR
eukprot:TRINITY_DN6258_c0_g1_i1.p1 TRINITY_DN6258_c0_g1~~TRINITY_DN6258_c0_g1_i1.p1  ORF type:complete len:416 (-),score=86.40 TRINITY_DN6258_c0_g1_i1:624-1871(-)